MITRLEIENFKAIRSLTLDLRPLTVLVGPNDSGKTTILQALNIVGQSLRWSTTDSALFGSDPRALLNDRSKPLRFAVELPASMATLGRLRYELIFEPNGKAMKCIAERLTAGTDDLIVGSGRNFRSPTPHVAWGGERTLLSAAVAHNPAEPYATLQRDLPAFYCAFEAPKMVAPSEADAELASTGAGLAGVLDRVLTAPDRDEVMARFNAALQRLSPTVRSISMRPADVHKPDGSTSKGKELLFTLPDKKTTVAASEASTGLVLAAGYLALIYGTSHRRFLIEEPENGVHPRALLTIVELLRELASEGRQVVATTHSPVLLDYMEPEDVQIVSRTRDGVSVTPMANSRFFDERSQRPTPGELWYSVGEDSLVSSSR